MNADLEPALPARFLRGLALNPHGPAIRFGGTTVSYEQAHELARRWAGSLLAGLPERPRRVAVLGDKGLSSYVGILAALYTGAAVVPLHPGFPPAHLRRMLEASAATAVIADAHGVDVLTRTGLDLPVLVPEDAALSTLPVRPERALDAPAAVRPDDLAYLLFTSGSTGRAKGVPITHASNQHYFELMDRRYDFRTDDVFSQTVELNFDCAMFDLFCAWGAGACVQAIPAPAMRDLPGFAAEAGLTVWFSVPSAISLVRRTGGLAPGSLPGLRWSLFAGEALHCADADDWQAAAPNSTVENLYGPTELTITITGHRWSPESAQMAVNGIVPIGTVHEGHEYLLLDGMTPQNPRDHARLHGQQEPREGELCIRGPQLTSGYLDPADDAGRFVQHGGQRWYRTGDRVRELPGGELIYLGRLDSQVQVHGLRVELAEIDQAVRACAGVTNAVTVARPASDGGAELVVYYTGEPISAAELARELRQVLVPGSVPRQYRQVADLPLNSNGKIDRAALTRRATEENTFAPV
jgi:amino acid adenylation domain-containing protein